MRIPGALYWIGCRPGWPAGDRSALWEQRKPGGVMARTVGFDDMYAIVDQKETQQ
jgi:hypothetical protein